MHSATPYRKVRSVNATNTSFPSKIPTGTEPSGDAGTATGASVIQLVHGRGGIVPCKAKFIFYGTGDANDVFEAKVIGWERCGSDTSTLWNPLILAHLVCTLGAMTGVAGKYLVATDLLVDTITVNSEPTITADTTRQGTLEISSPAADLIAFATVPLHGVEKIELIFDTTTGDPTGANALVSFEY